MTHVAGAPTAIVAGAQPAHELPAAMKAVVFDAPGGPSTLHVDEIPLPIKANSEFLVKVVAAGVNPIDAKTRAGRGVSPAIPSYPSTLGSEFSGVIVSTPYEGHPIKVGDEVFGMQGFPRVGGSYAEYVTVPELHLTKKPTDLTHLEAAGVPLAALTAWGLVVDIARAHEGQRLLIHAGAGGVGHFAVQLAHYFGAHVITTGSSRNITWLRDLGADEVIDYTTTRFEDVVSDVDAVIDLIGNVHDNTGTRSLSVLRHGGMIVNAPTGSWPTMLEEAEAAGVRATSYKVSPDGASLAVISRLITSGDLKVHVDKSFPLSEAAAAHELLEEGHTRGKIILQVSDC